MNDIFIKLFNMSIAASWLILAAIAVRSVLKKAPKRITVLLWALVAIRLVLPFSVKSSLSLVPSEKTLARADKNESTVTMNSGFGVLNSMFEESEVELGANTAAHETAISKPQSIRTTAIKTPQQLLTKIVDKASCIWAVGAALMLVYCAASYFVLSRRVKDAAHLFDNIYLIGKEGEAFVLGIIRPQIYLSETFEDGREYIIAHEKAHIARGDHIYKLLGFLLLALHWFNPLVWLAYALLCRDIEQACDERVVSSLDRAARADYSQMLLNCSARRSTVAACPLAFGGIGTRKRIKDILNYKKPAFILIVLALAVLIALSVFFLTDPLHKQKKKEIAALENTALPSAALPLDIRPLEEVKSGYTIDNAIADGCVVIDGNELLSGEKAWLDFYHEARSGSPAFVRIYKQYSFEDEPTVYFVEDISFDGEKYHSRLYDRNGDTDEEFLWEGEFKYLVRSSDGENGVTTLAYLLSDNENVSYRRYVQRMRSSTIPVYDDADYSNCELLFSICMDSDMSIMAFYDEAYIDVDGDGAEEKCMLGFGPTSGVYSFSFSVFKNGECIASNYYVTDWLYNIGFFKNAEGEYMAVGTGLDKESFYDIHSDNIDQYRSYRIIETEEGITLEMKYEGEYPLHLEPLADQP